MRSGNNARQPRFADPQVSRPKRAPSTMGVRECRYRSAMEKKRPNLSALYEAATSARSTEPAAVERRKRRPR